MDILAVRSFRVFLAVVLTANCFLSCYTFAYADEFQEVDNGISDYGGAQASGYAQEAQENNSFGSVSSSSDLSGDSLLVSSAHGDNDSLRQGVDSESDSLASHDDFFSSVLSFLEDITYLLGEIADYYRSGSVPGAGDGIGVLAGYGGSLTGGFGGAFSGGSGSGKSANLTDVADSFTAAWGYGYGGTAVFYKNSPAGWLQKLRDYNVNEYYDGYTYSTAKYLAFIFREMEQAETLSKEQFGYNYGGTAIIQKSSPAWYLQLAANRLNYNGSLAGGDPDDYSAARLLARIHNSQYGDITYTETGNTGTRSTIGVLGYVANLLYQNNLYSESATTRLHYVGGLVGEDGSGDYSAARLLARIHNGLYGSITYSETGNTGVRSAISVLGYIANLVYQGDQYFSSAATRLHYIGPLSGVDGEDDYSVARLLARIHNYDYSVSSVLDVITKGPEGGRVSLYNIGNSIETIKNETRDLDNLLESIDGRVSALDALGVRLANIALTTDEIKKGVNSSLQWYETLHGDLSMLRHGAADLLPGYADWTLWDFLQGIYFDIGQIVDLLKGLQQTLTAWGNRWDAQDLYLMEWAKRWDALDKSPVYLSETNKLLGRLTADVASIRDKYVLQDALSTILDVLVGDLQAPQTQAALSSIQDVMSTRFPFCIPSLVNVVLFGSVLADAAPPVWEFDIVGTPLVVDFSDYGQFAEVCRWTVLVLFTASLLLNTRRFIYGMGGGVE